MTLTFLGQIWKQCILVVYVGLELAIFNGLGAQPMLENTRYFDSSKTLFGLWVAIDQVQFIRKLPTKAVGLKDLWIFYLV